MVATTAKARLDGIQLDGQVSAITQPEKENSQRLAPTGSSTTNSTCTKKQTALKALHSLTHSVLVQICAVKSLCWGFCITPLETPATTR